MNVKLIGAALLACFAVTPTIASAQISINISVDVAPPPLPVYVQPPLPGPDFIWTPGYWAWDDYAYAYFWVPGTWVRAPRPGLLWTPPWWGWVGGAYIFHTGYWGPTVGFYGGVPYGFGYTGFGFHGGFWNGGHVSYNSAVTNVTNVTNVINVYHTTVIQNHVTRVSYNGGPGGVQARPTQQELFAAQQPHIAPTANQQTHFAAARNDPRLLASANHGRPPVLATPRALSPLRPAGEPALAGAVASGRSGRATPGSAAAMPERAPRPPSNAQAQPYGEPATPNDRALSNVERGAGADRDVPRPRRLPDGMPPDAGYHRSQPVPRDPMQQDYAAPRAMRPPSGGQSHSQTPPHYTPPRVPQPQPRQPRPQSQPHPQPHGENHPQHPKRDEHR